MKPLSELIRDWTGVTNHINELMKDKLPRIVGNESVRAVKQNFDLQGYDSGQGVTPWKPRTAKTNRSYDKRKSPKGESLKGSVYNSKSPLLLQTRNLYNGVKYQHVSNLIIVGVDIGLIPYAEKMNETRQYIPKPDQPPNAKILLAIKKKFDFEVEKDLKNFKL